MKQYICDECGNITYGFAPVKLKGISGISGQKYGEESEWKHFCRTECFWRWVSGCIEKMQGS